MLYSEIFRKPDHQKKLNGELVFSSISYLIKIYCILKVLIFVVKVKQEGQWVGMVWFLFENFYVTFQEVRYIDHKETEHRKINFDCG